MERLFEDACYTYESPIETAQSRPKYKDISQRRVKRTVLGTHEFLLARESSRKDRQKRWSKPRASSSSVGGTMGVTFKDNYYLLIGSFS